MMDPDASVVDAVFDAFRLGARRSACTGGTVEGEPTVRQEPIHMMKDDLYNYYTVKRREHLQEFHVNYQKVGDVWKLFETTDDQGREIDGITIVAEDIKLHIDSAESWCNELYIGHKLVCKRNPDRRSVDLMGQHGWEAYNDQKRRLPGGDSVVIARIEGAIRALWQNYPFRRKWNLPIHLAIGLDQCLLKDVERIEQFYYDFYYRPRDRPDWDLGKIVRGTLTPIEDKYYKYGYFYHIERNNSRISPAEIKDAVEQYQETLDKTALIEFMQSMYEPDVGLRDDLAHVLKTQLAEGRKSGTTPGIVSSGVEGVDYAILKQRQPVYRVRPRGYKLENPGWSDDDRKRDGALGTKIQAYFVKAALRDDGNKIQIAFECPCEDPPKKETS